MCTCVCVSFMHGHQLTNVRGGVGGGIESIREIRRENLQGLLKVIQLQCHGTCLIFREHFFVLCLPVLWVEAACYVSISIVMCEILCTTRLPSAPYTFRVYWKWSSSSVMEPDSSLKNCSWQRSTSLWPVCLCFEWKLLVVWVVDN